MEEARDRCGTAHHSDRRVLFGDEDIDRAMGQGELFRSFLERSRIAGIEEQ